MNVLQIDFNAPNAQQLFSESLRHTGFAVLDNHPIEWSFIADIYKEWMVFFASPQKENYRFNRETQDGFFPQSISEKAKGASLKDIKEYYQYYPWGQFPKELSVHTKELYQQLNTLAITLLTWLESTVPMGISQALSMPLSKMIENSEQTMLRVLHYPPLDGNEPIGAIRAAAHEDINLITLLVGATASGLQVKDTKGLWHDVPSSSKSIIVNVGDMLDLATQGYYRSTTHRVINPDNHHQARLSMPLFLHPRPEVPLSANKLAKQYLQERLRELGVL